MAKKKKSPSVRKPLMSPIARRIAVHCCGVIALVIILAVTFRSMRNYVERDVTRQDRPPRVVLKNRPTWMSDALAMQIVNSVKPTGPHSAFDRQLLIDTANDLKKNPWIKQVNQVRRAYYQRPADTLELDCEFRAPIAMIHWKDFYWLVDGDGVKLPDQFTAAQLPSIARGSDGQLNIRVIEGVIEPPVESGRKWIGDDVAAGLDMAKILYSRDFADQIGSINVANFRGRKDPKESQIMLLTTFGTQIHWGRPINAEDYFVEVSTAQKLLNLHEIYSQFHRVDGGHPWIDVRFDRITYPNDVAQVNAAQ